MPKKTETNKSHFEQINLTLVYVHNNFASDITAKDLAQISGYSTFHFHRIFKDIMGENVNDFIRNTRLEKASNLLLYNQHKTIASIAIDSGFATATGFSAAFKKKFEMTPKEWRKGGYEENHLSHLTNNNDKNINIDTPKIVERDDIPIIYIRIYGYENDISLIWNHMQEWSKGMNILDNPHRYLGIFHNHPSLVPYKKARYLACIQTTSNEYKSGKIGKCVLSKGKFAKFEFTCTHEKLYEMMHLAYMQWIPNSDYEVRNFPAYVEYKNPENLLLNGILECDFYMPIQLII